MSSVRSKRRVKCALLSRSPLLRVSFNIKIVCFEKQNFIFSKITLHFSQSQLHAGRSSCGDSGTLRQRTEDHESVPAGDIVGVLNTDKIFECATIRMSIAEHEQTNNGRQLKKINIVKEIFKFNNPCLFSARYLDKCNFTLVDRAAAAMRKFPNGPKLMRKCIPKAILYVSFKCPQKV